jgi:hypothetical protein
VVEQKRLEECQGYAQVDLVSLWALRLAFFFYRLWHFASRFFLVAYRLASRVYARQGSVAFFLLLWPLTMHEHLDHSLMPSLVVSKWL